MAMGCSARRKRGQVRFTCEAYVMDVPLRPALPALDGSQNLAIIGGLLYYLSTSPGTTYSGKYERYIEAERAAQQAGRQRPGGGSGGTNAPGPGRQEETEGERQAAAEGGEGSAAAGGGSSAGGGNPELQRRLAAAAAAARAAREALDREQEQEQAGTGAAQGQGQPVPGTQGGSAAVAATQAAKGKTKKGN
jgi:hypothetical protein